MIKVTIFNEFKHEQEDPKIREVYPDGIHGALKEFLESDDVTVHTVVEYDENLELIPNCGITEELLADTDVLIWWGHCAHQFVPDEVVEMCYNHILQGMGAIFLHSAHFSKLFKKLMGTTCSLKWRGGEKERLWNINPAHPIMQGIEDYFDIPAEEMYGERFDIPTPDELLMIGTYTSHEVFRSACTWQRGYGKTFYFQPGHETDPTYKIPEVQTIIKNAVQWAKPALRQEITCPRYEKIEL